MVQMEHPKLPGRTIEVPELGVAHRERAGWRRKKPSVPEQPKPVEKTETKPDRKSVDKEGAH